jgi:membrane protein implicated in regulation of membrane protease activity
MKQTENATLKTALIVIVVGLVIAGWSLLFSGQQTVALVIFALEATVLALYWWIDFFRHKGSDHQQGGDHAA